MQTYLELASLVAEDKTKPYSERLRLWKHYIELWYKSRKQT